MKTQKLGLDDFEAVGTSELLKVKGGMTTLLRVDSGGDGGCAEGDPDPFGGSYSMGEVTVYGDNHFVPIGYQSPPMFGQAAPANNNGGCQGCDFTYDETSGSQGWGRTLAWYGHVMANTDGCH